jgi:Zn-dependent protease
VNVDPTRIATGLVEILILLFAVSAHEAAHAWMADRCGDPTARQLGRVTLNPLRHIDPFGSVLLPVILFIAGAPVFGWARPTPVLTRNLRRARRDGILVTAAGPLVNLTISIVAAVLLAVAVRVVPDGRETATVALQMNFFREAGTAAPAGNFPLLFTLVQLSYLNGFLAIFNLVPIPPLDGGQILIDLMPADWAQKFAALRPFGFMIVMGLGMFGLLSLASAPLVAGLWLIIHL